MDVFKRQARQREADAEIDIGQGAADGVTALKHGDMRIEERVHGGVAVRGKLHIGEGIGIVVVLPRRVDHQVGFERLQQRQHHVFCDVYVTFVPGSRRKRDVHRPPKRAGAAGFRQEPRAGIQRPAVLMH